MIEPILLPTPLRPAHPACGGRRHILRHFFPDPFPVQADELLRIGARRPQADRHPGPTAQRRFEPGLHFLPYMRRNRMFQTDKQRPGFSGKAYLNLLDIGALKMLVQPLPRQVRPGKELYQSLPLDLRRRHGVQNLPFSTNTFSRSHQCIKKWTRQPQPSTVFSFRVVSPAWPPKISSAKGACIPFSQTN